MGKETWAIDLHPDSTPGPGEYNIPDNFGMSTPRYTMRKGFYNPTPKYNPEFLNTRTEIGGPKYTIRPRTIDTTIKTDSPGPCFTPPPFASSRTQRSYKTLPSKNPIEPKSPKFPRYNYSVEGPAEVNLRDHPQHTPAFTIGSKSQDLDWICGKDGPSAADYSPRYSKIQKKSPKFSIREFPKPRKRVAKSPGPETYKIKSEFGTKQITIQNPFPETKHDGPGPADYTISRELNHIQHAISPRQEDRQTTQSNVPYYDIPCSFGNTTPRSIHNLLKDPKPNITPSPTDYYPQEAKSCQTHWPDRHNPFREITPSWIPQSITKGPTEKPIEIPQPEPHFGFSYTEKDSWIPKNDFPGPGDYSPSIDSSRKRSPRFSIRSKCRPRDVDNATVDAPYVVLPPATSPHYSIRRRDSHPLVPK